MSVPEESILIPLVHTKIAGNTKDIQVVEHPTIVQKGLDVNTINDPVDVQSQPKEFPEASLLVQEGDEAAQLPVH